MDGFKLAFKEEIIPKSAHVAVYWIAPVISATAAFLAFAVIPFGPIVSIFGVKLHCNLPIFPCLFSTCWELRQLAFTDWSGRLVFGIDIPTSWGIAFNSPSDFLRNRYGAFICGSVPIRWFHVDIGNHRTAGTHLVRGNFATLVPHLCNVNGGGDQPCTI